MNLNPPTIKPNFLGSKGQATQADQAEQSETSPEKKETKPSNEVKKFRVSNFAYQFKTGAPTPLVAINNIYSPRSEEEKAFLEHQVSCGRILFS